MDITGIGSVADLIRDGIDKIWPDKTEQERQSAAFMLAALQGQLDANKAEAASPSTFVAGWRPFIGWVCGAGCAWNWIGLPVALFVSEALGRHLGLKPADLSEMMPLLLGMLGLGGLRTYEKVSGINAGH